MVHRQNRLWPLLDLPVRAPGYLVLFELVLLDNTQITPHIPRMIKLPRKLRSKLRRIDIWSPALRLRSPMGLRRLRQCGVSKRFEIHVGALSIDLRRGNRKSSDFLPFFLRSSME